MDLNETIDYEEFANDLNERAEPLEADFEQLRTLIRARTVARQRQADFDFRIRELRDEIRILNGFVLNNVSVVNQSIDGPAEERKQDRQQLAVLFATLNNVKQERAENDRFIEELDNDIRICAERVANARTSERQRNPNYSSLYDDDFTFQNDSSFDVFSSNSRAEQSSGTDAWLEQLLREADANRRNNN